MKVFWNFTFWNFNRKLQVKSLDWQWWVKCGNVGLMLLWYGTVKIWIFSDHGYTALSLSWFVPNRIYSTSRLLKPTQRCVEKLGERANKNFPRRLDSLSFLRHCRNIQYGETRPKSKQGFHFKNFCLLRFGLKTYFSPWESNQVLYLFRSNSSFLCSKNYWMKL